MKILHLIFSQQVAGAEKYLLDLLPGLKQKGIDCSLICVIPEPDAHKFVSFSDQLTAAGVSNQIFTGNKKNFLSVAKRINSHLKQNGIKYIHAHLFNADLIAVIIKKLFNKHVVILSTKHGYQEKYLNNNPVSQTVIPNDVYYYISKFINRNIDSQVTISKAMADLYYKLKLTKYSIPYIHHGINLTIDNDHEKKLRLGNPQLIIVGRIEEIKGHIYLLKAMPAVIKSFPGVKLLVIGNGTQKEKLQNFAQENKIDSHIEFMGFQQAPYNYMAQSDIVVLPSLYEPFGLVYIEAFASKTPVIAFNVQACNEIIENNETGILVPLFDHEKLAEKIILLLTDAVEKERIASNAFKRYKEYFNTERMVTETVTWYSSVIQQ